MRKKNSVGVRNRRYSFEGSIGQPQGLPLQERVLGDLNDLEKACEFIDGIEGRGMTNINEALLTALAEKPDPKRPRIVVFLTDGQPTAGVRNPYLS